MICKQFAVAEFTPLKARARNTGAHQCHLAILNLQSADPEGRRCDLSLTIGSGSVVYYCRPLQVDQSLVQKGVMDAALGIGSCNNRSLSLVTRHIFKLVWSSYSLALLYNSAQLAVRGPVRPLRSIFKYTASAVRPAICELESKNNLPRWSSAVGVLPASFLTHSRVLLLSLALLMAEALRRLGV